MTEAIETAPAMELAPSDMNQFVEELRTSHTIYSPLFQRREPREWAEKYLRGLLLELPRTSIEPMVLALEGAHPTAVRTRQVFISAGTWEDDILLQRHWQEVDHVLGEEEGGLTLDGSDLLKQGQESVGVKRQYCGEVGKRAHCQAGVYLGYASRQGYTLVDRRLSMPHEGVADEAYAERRRACGVSTDLTLKTKQRLGGEMIQTVAQAGTLRCRWVTCDEAFGRDTDLLDQIAGLGLWYCAEGPHDTQVWRQRPALAIPPWSGRGRKPTRTQVVAGTVESHTVTTLAAALPASAWSQQMIKEGSKGPSVAAFATQRVIGVREGLPGPEVWVILRRNGPSGELKTSRSNAPSDSPRATLARLSGMRWPIATCFEDGKHYLGMGDDEVRGWRGWHHHMTLCILAHFFLVRTCLRLKKSPGLNRPPSAGAVAQCLPPA